MKKIFLSLIAIGLSSQLMASEITFSDLTVVFDRGNNKCIDTVDNGYGPYFVKKLNNKELIVSDENIKATFKEVTDGQTFWWFFKTMENCEFNKKLLVELNNKIKGQ